VSDRNARRFTRRGAGSRASSLIETIIAMVMLTIAVLTLTTAYPYAFGRIGERDDELQAVSFGQQYMEQIRQQIRSGATTLTSATLPIDAGYALAFGVMKYPTPGPSPPPSPPAQLASPGNFTATATTNPALSASVATYDVKVTVSWSYGGAARSIVLQTVVTRQAL
jgi:type II secretory pathway pseudopilin PulG